jgi:hypothetical protein
MHIHIYTIVGDHIYQIQKGICSSKFFGSMQNYDSKFWRNWDQVGKLAGINHVGKHEIGPTWMKANHALSLWPSF